MNASRMYKPVVMFFLAVAVASSLGGCVVGQTLELDHEATATPVVASGQALVVDVEDRRPYVLSGDKPPSYVGKYRGGFGNPWDVNTASAEPLADIIMLDLKEQASEMGFAVQDSAERTLQVRILEWNLDTYQNGRFWCEIDVSALGEDGSSIATRKVEHSEYLKGSFWTGGKAGAEREMPRIYSAVIEQLLQDNPEIVRALLE